MTVRRIVAILACCLGATAQGQDTPPPLESGKEAIVSQGVASTIADLDRRLQDIEKARAAPAVGSRDGFMLRSADGLHQMRITGQIQADYRVYPMRGDATDLDMFLIRRARLGIEANVFKHYEFRLLPEWGANRPTIQDAYMNVRYQDELQFQIGKFKQPVSYEQLIQDRFVPTMERSLIDQVVPARDVGMMIHGQKLLQNQVDYAVGVFNGEPNGDLDSNKLRDLAGRLAWRPLESDLLPDWLRPLQIGISGTVGKEEELLNLNGSGTPNVIRTPGNIPWLSFQGRVRAEGLRTRVTPEFSYIFQSFGLASQFLRMDQEVRMPGERVQSVRFEGFYVLTSYLLTGEIRTTYSQPIQPLRPFDPQHPFICPGAWEVVARVSHLQFDPAIFGAGLLADSTRNGESATEMTLGFNWYLNTLVRMQFNWEHAWFRRPVLLAPGHAFRQTDAVLMRFQIIF